MSRALILCMLVGCAANDQSTGPTATLTGNGKTALTANIGDSVTFVWSSTDADSATSTVHMSPRIDACGNTDGPWVIDTIAGSLPPAQILPCQTGIVYTLTMIAAQTASDDTGSAALTISVN